MTGYTLHQVTEKIDEGEIFFQEVVPIDGIRSGEALDQKIAQRAALKFSEYLDCIHRAKKMEAVKVDAYRIYKTHVKYLSFPK